MKNKTKCIIYLIIILLISILLIIYPPHFIKGPSMQHDSNFDEWWEKSKEWYIENEIDKNYFGTFPYKNGVNKWDASIVYGIMPEKIKLGDVIEFVDTEGTDVTHRVVNISKQDGKFIFTTKGDNYETNPEPKYFEKETSEERIIGKSIFIIPRIFYIPIIFVLYFIFWVIKRQ